MENETGLWIIGVLMIVLAVVNMFGYMAMSDQEGEVNFDLTDQNNAIMELENAVNNLADSLIVEEVGDYMLSKSEYEDQITEAKAEEMALAEMDSRDFKKAVCDALENYAEDPQDIDSYKDITEIKVMDSDVDGDNVTLEVKVYYFLDGDEEETEKARIEFTITIDELDYDEEFSEAEVNGNYLDNLEVMKVYN